MLQDVLAFSFAFYLKLLHPSIASFAIGIVWMMALAHSEISAKTYISENALLPGMATTQYRNTHYADEVYQRLQKDCMSGR